MLAVARAVDPTVDRREGNAISHPVIGEAAVVAGRTRMSIPVHQREATRFRFAVESTSPGWARFAKRRMGQPVLRRDAEVIATTGVSASMRERRPPATASVRR